MSLWACSRHLSKLDFDVLINLHPNERCSFIDAMTSVKLRTGTTHKIFKWFWDVFTPLDRSMHAADMYLDVLQQLGVQDLSNNGLEIFPGEEHFLEAELFWQEQNITDQDKLIGFNIGSAVPTKRWPPERFAEVADIFAAKGYKTVFLAGQWMKRWLRKQQVICKRGRLLQQDILLLAGWPLQCAVVV